MTATTGPQLTVTRVLNAPRALVYRAFTDPDLFATWWGPVGNELPRDEIDFDIRPGGHQRWTEDFPAQPGVRVAIRLDLTEAVEGELLDGIMRVTGRLLGGYEPFETRVRVEFHDEADGRTRLEISQWLPDHLVSPSAGGWGESLTKLETALSAARNEPAPGTPRPRG